MQNLENLIAPAAAALPPCLVKISRIQHTVFVDEVDEVNLYSTHSGRPFPKHILFFGMDEVHHNKIAGSQSSWQESWDLLAKLKDSATPTPPAFYFSFETIQHFPKFLAAIAKLGWRRFYLAFSEPRAVGASLPILRECLEEDFQNWHIQGDRNILITLGIALGTPITMPRRSVIEVYNDCNLKCDFCWTHSPYRNPDAFPASYFKQRPEKEMIFKYVNELAEFDMEIVELCAVGDPLFNPDIWEIIDHIKSKGLRLRISTNGTLISQTRADRMVAIGVEELFMNISAGDRETYARIHNVGPNIFDSLHANLKYVAKQRRGKANLLAANVINVITANNCRNLSQMIEFARDVEAAYVDFRRVWASEEFLHSLEFSKADLHAMLDHKEKISGEMQATGIPSNLAYFFSDMEKLLQEKSAAPERVKSIPMRYAVDKSQHHTYLPVEVGPNTSLLKDNEHLFAQPFQVDEALDTSQANAVCSVAYHFTLLDNNSQVRFCCMGKRIYGNYESSIAKVWRDFRYTSFRKEWRKNYQAQSGICQGCPHVGENMAFHNRLERFGLMEYLRKPL